MFCPGGEDDKGCRFPDMCMPGPCEILHFLVSKLLESFCKLVPFDKFGLSQQGQLNDRTAVTIQVTVTVRENDEKEPTQLL
jgi:hypothetical protein